jgi:hypothetical protein
MTDTGNTQQATAHTPEPWTYNHMAVVQDARGRIVADCEIVAGGDSDGLPEEEVANARRICAAVNACRGIPTGALEQGVVGELLEALQAQQMAEYNPEASRRKGYFDRARELRGATLARAASG